MYNSRPRVSRFTSEFEVPQNYSGNAFREENFEENFKEETVVSEEHSVEKNVEESVPSSSDKVCEPPTKKKGLFGGAGFGFDMGRLFSGGIGYEELLIIGLILLVAQNEGNEDILLLLVLLLFVG